MNGNHYGRAYASMFHRSLVGKGPVAFALWTYVVSHAYPAAVGGELIGVVSLNSYEVATLIGCDQSEIDGQIEVFCLPDPKSNSKLAEGRKLVRLSDYLFRVVNFMEYRNKVSDSPEAIKNREAASRSRRKNRKRTTIRRVHPATTDLSEPNPFNT